MRSIRTKWTAFLFLVLMSTAITAMFGRGFTLSRPALTTLRSTARVLPELRPQLFEEKFMVSWSKEHVNVLDGGQSIQLVLDKTSGAGFQSRYEYTYGYFSVNMKLVPGNSAGTVTAFYLFSKGENHDEVDYEFLGNSTGEPYTLQTNVFANGKGEREQRIRLWFDPTTDYHAYSFLWNHEHIVMMVDSIPIRLFKNLQSSGVDYPSWRPMGLYSSIFDASTWATRGGRVPIDYNDAPFIASYTGFKVDACLSDGGSHQCASDWSDNWWEHSSFKALNSTQQRQLREVRNLYLQYDYCTDTYRNPVPPVECSYNNLENSAGTR